MLFCNAKAVVIDLNTPMMVSSVSLLFPCSASNITPAICLPRWLSGEVMGYFVVNFSTCFIALECKISIFPSPHNTSKLFCSSWQTILWLCLSVFLVGGLWETFSFELFRDWVCWTKRSSWGVRKKSLYVNTRKFIIIIVCRQITGAKWDCRGVMTASGAIRQIRRLVFSFQEICQSANSNKHRLPRVC